MQDSDVPALNWFLSPCVISMYRYSRRSWSVITVKVSVSLTEQQDHLGSVLNIYLPGDTDAGLGSYIFWNPRWKRIGAWSTEDWVGREHYFTVHFLPGLYFFVTCGYCPLPFPLVLFLFIWLLMFLKCRWAEKFSLQYGPVSGFGLATAEAKCLEPLFRVTVEHCPVESLPH